MAFNFARTALVLVGVGYLLFVVDCGDKTAFQHIMAIARTDEAQEFRHDVRASTKDLRGQVIDQVTEERARDREAREANQLNQPNQGVGKPATAQRYNDAADP